MFFSLTFITLQMIILSVQFLIQFQALSNSLANKANKAVDWFHVNKMIVNPEKFKAILLTKSKENTTSRENHIQELCQRGGSAQLNALK